MIKYSHNKQLKDDLKVVKAFRVAKEKLNRLSNLSELGIGDVNKLLVLIDDLNKLSIKYERTMKNQ
jgi:uncharacterized protein (UPF0371 family)